MDRWDFLKWRKTLRLTQSAAGERFGINRSTIQNWESGKSSVPISVELACLELTRRWKQRSDFGPIGLLYSDRSIWDIAEENPCTFAFHCERHSTNASAIEQACRLRRNHLFSNPIIIEQNGDLVWSTDELLRECDSHRSARKGTRTSKKPRNDAPAVNTGAPDKRERRERNAVKRQRRDRLLKLKRRP